MATPSEFKRITAYNIIEIEEIIPRLDSKSKAIIYTWIRDNIRIERHSKTTLRLRMVNLNSLKNVILPRGAIWDKENRCYILPLSGVDDTFRKAFSLYDTDGIIEKVMQEKKECLKMSYSDKGDGNAEWVREFVSLNGSGYYLYPYQIAGVEFLSRLGSALIGDEMGLGKTVQALAFTFKHKAYPCLVICPKSVEENWKREIEKWMPSKKEHFTILPYSRLNKYEKRPYRTLILDEGHYIKNIHSQRTHKVFEIAGIKTYGKDLPEIEHRIILTGTPVMNTIEEMYPVLRMLDPLRFKSSREFDRFILSHKKELQTFLRSHYMLRREKKDVLADLPQKTREIITLNKKHTPEYNELKMLEREIAGEIERAKATYGWNFWNSHIFLKEFLSRLVVLFKEHRIKSGIMKVEDVVKDVVRYDRSVVFYCHHEVGDSLKDRLKDEGVSVEQVDGRHRKRDEIIERWKKGGNCLLCSVQAMGEGINLTEASNVFFIQMDWTPARNIQAESRCHRIGQRLPVHVRWYIVEDTIEQHIIHKLNTKTSVIDTVTGSNTENEKHAKYWKEILREISETLSVSDYREGDLF